MEFAMRPIGVIHTPFAEGDAVPTQSWRSGAAGWVEIYPEFAEGLDDIEGFSHIYLIFVFDRSSGYSLKVVPYRETSLRGLFATRSPHRPNPIGLSLVRLLGREGPILRIEGADMLDGTPLLDIKPFVLNFDWVAGSRRGWTEAWDQEQD